MTRRHEERYQRVVSKITPEKEADARALALKELGFLKYETLMLTDRDRVDALACHKLGKRWVPA